MLKYIGVFLFLTGAALTLIILLSGKKAGIKEKKEELLLITESGYVSTHSEAKRAPKIESESSEPKEIKVAPKKRTLSNEAKEILARVEKERAEEKVKSAAPKKYDATEPMQKRASASEASSTDILERQNHKEQPESAHTDVLDGPWQQQQESESTDVLDKGRGLTQKDPTDVMKRDVTPSRQENGTDLLRRPESTASSATDILRKEEAEPVTAEDGNATDVLHRTR